MEINCFRIIFTEYKPQQKHIYYAAAFLLCNLIVLLSAEVLVGRKEGKKETKKKSRKKQE
jgi:hypothetical protein